ncbi:carbon-monoxide dehydrogenase medium subunit [Variovorax sp. HW608]|uniref:FAD binding domain-containing protein n=1 Tax=Variovorax sp. HW608 TaxID=1034889 RepID=UPI00081FCA28|nr:FAD binding domain-containing protein [Variovorax sp. HW608]SCK14169.1 carbon-monoxide dehydrogenase medium subunit [Variovorax sp. HW608]
MYPAPFAYHQPRTLEEVLALLGKLEGDVKLVAGGQSLLPTMKLRMSQPDHLVDLSGVASLRTVERSSQGVAVGAMATHYEVEASALLRQLVPALPMIASGIADAQVRNLGTLGGSLANADPAADYPAAVLALDAVIEVAGPRGSRSIPALEWATGLMSTSCAPDEIIVRVHFPAAGEREGAAYVKVPHPASRFAVVGVAARLKMAAGGECTLVRLSTTGVAHCALRAHAAEQVLLGRMLDDAVLAKAAAVLAAEVPVVEDGLLGETAKRQLCRMSARKALRLASAAAREAMQCAGGDK